MCGFACATVGSTTRVTFGLVLCYFDDVLGASGRSGPLASCNFRWSTDIGSKVDDLQLAERGLQTSLHTVENKNQPEVFLHRVVLRPPRVMDVRAFASRTSAQKTFSPALQAMG